MRVSQVSKDLVHVVSGSQVETLISCIRNQTYCVLIMMTSRQMEASLLRLVVLRTRDARRNLRHCR